MKLGNALAEYQQALKLEELDQVLAVYNAAAVMAQAIEDHIVGEAMNAARRNTLLPEFVTVISRTATSARGWRDECDFGSNGWVSPREAFDWAYQHVRDQHNAG